AGEAPHAYRSMLAGGVNVALGTDSILCLDTPDRISTLDEMRLLRRRDGTDPVTLLAMATIHGARALGFDEGLVEFSPGPMLGVLAVDGAGDDPLDAALRGNAPPRWVAGPFPCPPDALR
ncbi:MAG: amidohydrolase family protein, partial [Phycisphaerales bacterium]|nr:amidohydrolase family protein [Phycisphaerales bacterium]